MTGRFNLIAFIATVVLSVALAEAQTPDCNGNGVPDHIDLAGRMYWADLMTGRIQRADLDGLIVEDLVTMGLTSPEGIALDPAAGKMYWTDAAKIQRADLDGSNVEGPGHHGIDEPR